MPMPFTWLHGPRPVSLLHAFAPGEGRAVCRMPLREQMQSETARDPRGKCPECKRKVEVERWA